MLACVSMIHNFLVSVLPIFIEACIFSQLYTKKMNTKNGVLCEFNDLIFNSDV